MWISRLHSSLTGISLRHFRFRANIEVFRAARGVSVIFVMHFMWSVGKLCKKTLSSRTRDHT